MPIAEDAPFSEVAARRRKRRRRLCQFRLRTLLILMALCAVGAAVWRTYLEPYRRQRQTMALIEKWHGTYKTTEANVWLRWVCGADLQNVIVVDLADCDEPAAYVDAIAAFPKLETLVVGGTAFSDEHLRPFERVATLRRVLWTARM